MRIVLQHANLRATDELDASIEQALHDLSPFVAIEEARIRLEYDHEASPPYRAFAHLVIPGPDLHADAVDHTARTVLAKLFAVLRTRAMAVAARRSRRRDEAKPVRLQLLRAARMA
jgi:hypothetical protein